jgi:hypothetical protein
MSGSLRPQSGRAPSAQQPDRLPMVTGLDRLLLVLGNRYANSHYQHGVFQALGFIAQAVLLCRSS